MRPKLRSPSVSTARTCCGAKTNAAWMRSSKRCPTGDDSAAHRCNLLHKVHHRAFFPHRRRRPLDAQNKWADTLQGFDCAKERQLITAIAALPVVLESCQLRPTEVDPTHHTRFRIPARRIRRISRTTAISAGLPGRFHQELPRAGRVITASVFIDLQVPLCCALIHQHGRKIRHRCADHINEVSTRETQQHAGEFTRPTAAAKDQPSSTRPGRAIAASMDQWCRRPGNWLVVDPRPPRA